MAAYATWLILFGVVVIHLSHTLTLFRRDVAQLSNLGQLLETSADHSKESMTVSQNITNDLNTFQSILNYMPQTEAHTRAQKALLDDVQSLRSQIGRRLKGRLHILVDTKANIVYLKEGMKLLMQADCSVGRGGIYTDKKTGRRWEFITPRGKFRVLRKFPDPVWIKPDWAFAESGEVPPPPDDPKRRVEGELGAFVLSLGNGYLIHGTKHEDLLGRPASHGCVRLGADPLKKLYEQTPVGTEVYIY